MEQRLIDANAVIDELKRTCDRLNDESSCRATAIGFIHLLENLPTVDAVPVVHGRWLLDGRCSECLANPLTTHKTYCPNCGAKMMEVDDGQHT